MCLCYSDYFFILNKLIIEYKVKVIHILRNTKKNYMKGWEAAKKIFRNKIIISMLFVCVNA